MNDEKETTPLERWREMFTPEARAERRRQGEHARQQRSTAIERAFGKQTSKEEANELD